MAQETQTGALYQTRGVGWGGRWEGGSKGRGYMSKADLCWCLTETTKFCKAIILQLKKTKYK